MVIIYVVLAISAIGILISGLVFNRHTWRILMLLVCVIIFMAMLLTISNHFDWRRGTSKLIGVCSCTVLLILSFKIKKTED